mmetsp:Transcript_6296/g.15262  ORF Transcript_6296/g.15262 Transcript_6296/m.15262 type:complete len:240 (+) Transcript_6296:2932-3651(+)
MLNAVKHDDAIGMTLEEFTDMMHQAELGFTLGGGKSGLPSLGGMLQKNMKKVLKYKSKEAEALAIRNEIAHKKQDGGDMLDSFLSKENAQICARCHSKYDPGENKEGCCTYHKQQGKTSGSNVENHQQTVVFPVDLLPYSPRPVMPSFSIRLTLPSCLPLTIAADVHVAIRASAATECRLGSPPSARRPRDAASAATSPRNKSRPIRACALGLPSSAPRGELSCVRTTWAQSRCHGGQG